MSVRVRVRARRYLGGSDLGAGVFLYLAQSATEHASIAREYKEEGTFFAFVTFSISISVCHLACFDFSQGGCLCLCRLYIACECFEREGAKGRFLICVTHEKTSDESGVASEIL